MRKAMVLKKQYAITGPAFIMVDDYEAMFHCWGADYEEFESGPGNYTVAILEKEDGSVVLEHPSRVRFISGE